MYQNHRRMILNGRNGFLIEVNYLLSFYLLSYACCCDLKNSFCLLHSNASRNRFYGVTH